MDPLGNKDTINGSLENKKNPSENGDREKEDIDLKIEQTDAENGDIDLKIEQTNADNVKSETQTETNANAMEVNSNENGKISKSSNDSTEGDASVEVPTYEKASDEIHINGDEESQKASEEDGSGDSKKVSDKPDVTDIFGSGELIKETLSKGKGVHTRPNFGEVCIFNVTTRLEDGTVVDQKTNFKCILGHLEVVQALDLTLMLMEIGETARVTSVSKFTTPKLDFNPSLPEDVQKLVYEVELLDVDPIPNYYNMNSEELNKTLLRKKELGNFSMAKDDHTTALSTYNYAKEIIDQATSTIDTSIKVAIWNNMAACYLKMQNYSAVVDHTNKVLLLQPTNVKAMFRKGKALGLSGEYKEALVVLNKGIQVATEKDLKLFHQAASEFKQKMNKANEKEKAMYKAMFSPDSKAAGDKKSTASTGLSWWTIGAAAAVVVALGAALIKINLSNS